MEPTAVEMANKILQARRKAELCTQQCRLLSELACLVTERVVQCQHHEIHVSQASMDEISGVLGRVLQLVQACRKKVWILKPLLHQQNQEEFEAARLSLLECLDLLAISALQAGHEASFILDKLQASASDRDDFVQAASADGQRLLHAAEEAVKWGICRYRLNKSYVNGIRLAQDELLIGLEMDANRLPRHLLIDHRQLKVGIPIGQGSYASVCEATFLGCSVAVKFFDKEQVATFSDELNCLLSLKHPNIVSTIGFCHIGNRGKYLLVMEKMDRDLNNLINQEGSLPQQTLISIMLQISTAMELVHSKNMIHRDLKSSNILVSCPPGSGAVRIKIADFGIARMSFVTTEVSCPTPRRGTTVFMAPEVYDAKGYSRKADVFSFAMICCHAITGKLPYEGIQRDQLVQMKREGNGPQLPSSVPVEIATLLRRCWSVEADSRPSFSEISDTLRVFKMTAATGASFEEVRRYLSLHKAAKSKAAGQQQDLAVRGTLLKIETSLMEAIIISGKVDFCIHQCTILQKALIRVSGTCRDSCCAQELLQVVTRALHLVKSCCRQPSSLVDVLLHQKNQAEFEDVYNDLHGALFSRESEAGASALKEAAAKDREHLIKELTKVGKKAAQMWLQDLLFPDFHISKFTMMGLVGLQMLSQKGKNYIKWRRQMIVLSRMLSRQEEDKY